MSGQGCPRKALLEQDVPSGPVQKADERSEGTAQRAARGQPEQGEDLCRDSTKLTGDTNLKHQPKETLLTHTFVLNTLRLQRFRT